MYLSTMPWAASVRVVSLVHLSYSWWADVCLLVLLNKCDLFTTATIYYSNSITLLGSCHLATSSRHNGVVKTQWKWCDRRLLCYNVFAIAKKMASVLLPSRSGRSVVWSSSYRSPYTLVFYIVYTHHSSVLVKNDSVSCGIGWSVKLGTVR